MSDNTPSFSKYYHPVLISLFTLITFLALFIFRSLDNNRLTSWNWA
jgi:hypothetical protein